MGEYTWKTGSFRFDSGRVNFGSTYVWSNKIVLQKQVILFGFGSGQFGFRVCCFECRDGYVYRSFGSRVNFAMSLGEMLRFFYFTNRGESGKVDECGVV